MKHKGRRDRYGLKAGDVFWDYLTLTDEFIYKDHRRFYRFDCACGEATWQRKDDVVKGRVRSCGCKRLAMLTTVALTHGYSTGEDSRLYHCYVGMLKRCMKLDPEDENYEYYRGKGISVCPEWTESFEAFRAWALANGYGSTLTIDRIDTDGDYCPENCRWVPRSAQAQNSDRRTQAGAPCQGVKLIRGKWAATIFYNHKDHSLGLFKDVRDAIRARKAAEQKYHPYRYQKETADEVIARYFEGKLDSNQKPETVDI